VSGQAPFVFTNTYVPTTTAVLLVAGVSPAVDLADPLLQLFAKVSDSLTVHQNGTATPTGNTDTPADFVQPSQLEG
jgi:hypothetical protein